MLTSRIAIIVATSFSIFLASCAKEGPTGPQGNPGPAYTGSISGHVSLYDQYGNKILKNLDSVAISLGSNSVPGIPDTVSRADTTGYYIYNTIATGQYYISAYDTSYGLAGSGYGATINNFEFVSGNLNLDIKLSAKPDFSVSFIAKQTTTADSLTINCTPDAQIRSCVIFVTGSPSYANGESYLLSYVKNIPAYSTSITAIIDSQELHAAGFASNSWVYYTVFSEAYNDQSAYEDPATGKTVYTAVSHPTIDSIQAP